MAGDVNIPDEALRAATVELWGTDIGNAKTTAERAVCAAAPHIWRAARVALLLEMAATNEATGEPSGLYLAAGYRERAEKEGRA